MVRCIVLDIGVGGIDENQVNRSAVVTTWSIRGRSNHDAKDILTPEPYPPVGCL